MQEIPVVALIGAGLWLVGWLAFGMARMKKRESLWAMPENILFIVAVVLMALAPCFSLLIYALSETKTVWGGSVHALAALVLFAASNRVGLNPDSPQSPMTFREKSAAVVLLTLCLVYSAYFVFIVYAGYHSIVDLGTPFVAAIPVFIGAVVVQIALIIMGHVGAALFHAPLDELNDGPDERDYDVAQRSARNAYYVLVSGIWIVPVIAFLALPAWVVANTVLAVIVLAEIVKNASMVFYYRLGYR